MPSRRPVTALQAFLCLVQIIVVVALFFVAVASGMPASIIVLVAVGLARLYRSSADDEPEERSYRPAVSRGRWTPVLPQAVDRDHPLFDRELDG
jgi:hypothetical protein